MPDPIVPYSELLKSYRHGKECETWNGLKVLAIDPKTSEVLMNAGGALPHDPASLNKLMVFYLAMEALRTNGTPICIGDHCVIPRTAAKLESAKVKPNQKMTFDLLLQATMVGSDNGAAQVVLDTLQQLHPDMTMVDRMNAKARELGMKDTRFTNAHGLPNPANPNQTTPNDMALLLGRIMKEFPDEARQYMGADSVTYSGRDEPAHHFLKNPTFPQRLSNDYTVVAKTGYTNRAKHNIASVITAPDGREVLLVVMGVGTTTRAERNAMGVETGVTKKELRKQGLPAGTVPDEVPGKYLRDALVHQLADDLFDEMRAREQARDAFKAIGVESISGKPVNWLLPEVKDTRPFPMRVTTPSPRGH